MALSLEISIGRVEEPPPPPSSLCHVEGIKKVKSLLSFHPILRLIAAIMLQLTHYGDIIALPVVCS